MKKTDYTFERFVSTSSNIFARRAAEAVCMEPGTKYNPLYLYGPPGVGKTHLLTAIENCFEENRKHPVFISGNRFLEELIKAIRGGKCEEFREKYRQADVLLIDNLQYIAGKEASQEEMLEIVEILKKAGKQIVIAADSATGRMPEGFREEIQSFLATGLCVGMQMPDFEARAVIVSERLKEYGIHWPKEACNYVALKTAGNAYHIQGEINNIIACKELI